MAEEEPPPCRENRQQGDTCENVLETERHFCVMPFSLEHTCVNCAGFVLSLRCLFLSLHGCLSMVAFGFKVLLSFFEAEK